MKPTVEGPGNPESPQGAEARHGPALNVTDVRTGRDSASTLPRSWPRQRQRRDALDNARPQSQEWRCASMSKRDAEATVNADASPCHPRPSTIANADSSRHITKLVIEIRGKIHTPAAFQSRKERIHVGHLMIPIMPHRARRSRVGIDSSSSAPSRRLAPWDGSTKLNVDDASRDRSTLATRNFRALTPDLKRGLRIIHHET